MELDFDRSLFFLRVSLELIRIFGSIQHIRPVLESLLHRLLISALPEDRCETLKSLNSVSLLFNFLFLILSPPPSLHLSPLVHTGRGWGSLLEIRWEGHSQEKCSLSLWVAACRSEFGITLSEIFKQTNLNILSFSSYLFFFYFFFIHGKIFIYYIVRTKKE